MGSRDYTFAVAARAVELMTLHGESALPRSYEVWFTFLSGQNPGLNSAVGAALAAHGRLSDSDIETLHRAHLSTDRLACETNRVGAGVAEEIDILADVIRRALDSVSRYERSLSALTDAAPGIGADRLSRSVIDALVDATREMSRTNRQLEARIRTSHDEIEQLRSSLEAVRQEAVTDPLTGLANRRQLETTLAFARDMALVEATPLSLILIDIDRFKRLNDRYGHVTGDQVLRLVAGVMRAALPRGATLARFGGEEFVVILPGTALPDAVQRAEEIRRTIASRHLVRRGSGESLGPVTISLGVVALGGHETGTALLERADRCLYEAKNSGRNRTVSERDMAPEMPRVA